MWYRVKTEDGQRRFIDERVLAEWKADCKKFEVETENRWLGGVVNEFTDDTWSDGDVLDEIVSLIDNGECNA